MYIYIVQVKTMLVHLRCISTKWSSYLLGFIDVLNNKYGKTHTHTYQPAYVSFSSSSNSCSIPDIHYAKTHNHVKPTLLVVLELAGTICAGVSD